MDTRKVVGAVIRNLFRLSGLFLLFVAVLQFQDNFIGYGLVSVGLSFVILFFSFRGLILNWKGSRDFR